MYWFCGKKLNALALYIFLMVSKHCMAINITIITTTVTHSTHSLNYTVMPSSMISLHNHTSHLPNHNTTTIKHNSIIHPNDNTTKNDHGYSNAVTEHTGIIPTTMMTKVLPSHTPVVTVPPIMLTEIPVQDYALTYKFIVDGKFSPIAQNTTNVHSNLGSQNRTASKELRDKVSNITNLCILVFRTSNLNRNQICIGGPFSAYLSVCGLGVNKDSKSSLLD